MKQRFKVNDLVCFHDKHCAGYHEQCMCIGKIIAIHFNKGMRRWEAWINDHSSSMGLNELTLYRKYDSNTKWNVDDVLAFPDGSSGIVEKIKVYFGSDCISNKQGKIFYGIAGKFKLIDEEDL